MAFYRVTNAQDEQQGTATESQVKAERLAEALAAEHPGHTYYVQVQESEGAQWVQESEWRDERGPDVPRFCRQCRSIERATSGEWCSLHGRETSGDAIACEDGRPWQAQTVKPESSVAEQPAEQPEDRIGCPFCGSHDYEFLTTADRRLVACEACGHVSRFARWGRKVGA